MKIDWLFVVALLVTTVSSLPARAADLTRPVHYSQTAWIEKDGLLSPAIRAIAQDGRGYLWLATTTGLVRFDGVRFMSADALGISSPRSTFVVVLSPATNGSLWVGSGGTGGVSRLDDDRLTDDNAVGAPTGPINAVIEDRDGVIWVGGSFGVSRLQNGQWEPVREPYGLGDQVVHSLYQDRQGTLWVATENGVFRRPADTEHFNLFWSADSVRGFAEDAFGTMWVTTWGTRSDAAAGSRRDSGVPNQLPKGWRVVPGWRIMADRRGTVWVATVDEGVVRISRTAASEAPVLERLSVERNLTTNAANSLFEDREGNIWVGTSHGLNRFAETRVEAVPADRHQQISQRFRALAATPDGSVWAGTDHILYQYLNGRTRSFDRSRGLEGSAIGALNTDTHGVLWLASDRGQVGRWTHEHFEPLPLPPEPRLNVIVALATDAEGTLWMCDYDKGLFQWQHGTLKAPPSIPPALRRVARSLVTDSRGRVWIGFRDGSLGVFDAAGFRLTDLAKGHEQPDNVGPMYADAEGFVWIGTSAGVTRFRDGSAITVGPRNGLPGRNVTAIVEDDNGYLWIGLTTGIVRVHRREFDRVHDNDAYRIQFDIYDIDDGVPGSSTWYGSSSAVRSVDNRVWLVTSQGLAAIDANNTDQRANIAPPVVIESAESDQGTLRPPYTTAPAILSSRLRIDYTALTFVAPRRVSFKYRLKGFDRDWVDAGTRRQAFYTNLPPGAYEFEVTAGNDGNWNATGATWQFSVPPTMVQSAWFRGAIAVLGLAGVLGGWKLRVRQVRRRFALVLAERARVARELHDTLLQCLSGVAMQCDGLAAEVESSPHRAKYQLERLRKEVEVHIRDTRQAIWDLRSPSLGSYDFHTALRTRVESTTAGAHMRCEFLIKGTPPLRPRQVEEQLLRIGQEAVTNAVRHSGATVVQVTLTYENDGIVLRIADDGRGFDVQRQHDAAPRGHWGLATMYERALQVGGCFKISSRPACGTEVEVRVPVASRRRATA